MSSMVEVVREEALEQLFKEYFGASSTMMFTRERERSDFSAVLDILRASGKITLPLGGNMYTNTVPAALYLGYNEDVEQSNNTVFQHPPEGMSDHEREALSAMSYKAHGNYPSQQNIRAVIRNRGHQKHFIPDDAFGDVYEEDDLVLSHPSRTPQSVKVKIRDRGHQKHKLTWSDEEI